MARKEFVESRVKKCITDKEQAQLDFENGTVQNGGMGEDYYTEYSTLYQKEQNETARSGG